MLDSARELLVIFLTMNARETPTDYIQVNIYPSRVCIACRTLQPTAYTNLVILSITLANLPLAYQRQMFDRAMIMCWHGNR